MVRLLEVLEILIDFSNIIAEIVTIILCFSYIFTENNKYLIGAGFLVLIIMLLGKVQSIVINKLLEIL